MTIDMNADIKSTFIQSSVYIEVIALLEMLLKQNINFKSKDQQNNLILIEEISSLKKILLIHEVNYQKI